jgi:hypothetical protein
MTPDKIKIGKILYTIYIIFIVQIISIAGMNHLFLNLNTLNFFIGIAYLILFLLYLCELYILYNKNITFNQLQFILSYFLIIILILILVIIIFNLKIKQSKEILNDKKTSLFDDMNLNKSKIYFLFCFLFTIIFILTHYSPQIEI